MLLSTSPLAYPDAIVLLLAMGAVASAIISIWGVVKIIGEIYKLVKKPNLDQDARILSLEEALKVMQQQMIDNDIKYKRYFDNDNLRIKYLEKGTAVTQKALVALLDHGISGNNLQQMEDAKEALVSHMAGGTNVN